MKQKFFKIAKDNNIEILSYQSYKSDLGCQVFLIQISVNEDYAPVWDGNYPIGTGNFIERDKLLPDFEEFLLTNKERGRPITWA